MMKQFVKGIYPTSCKAISNYWEKKSKAEDPLKVDLLANLSFRLIPAQGFIYLIRPLVGNEISGLVAQWLTCSPTVTLAAKDSRFESWRARFFCIFCPPAFRIPLSFDYLCPPSPRIRLSGRKTPDSLCARGGHELTPLNIR